MKKLLFFLVLTVCGQLSYSQNAILRGRVTIQNSGFMPLENAQIKSKGANAQTTDSHGDFKLIYFNHIAGDAVQIDVQKSGYEVVNSKELLTKISANEFDTLKIWVCKTGDLAKRRIEFYQINVKQITERYNGIIRNLTRQNKFTADTLQKLEKNKQLLLANVRELVDNLTIKNLDECSALNKQAYLLVQEGKADEAIQILQDTVLNKSLEAAKQELAESKRLDSLSHAKLQNAKNAINQVAESFSLKATLFEQNFDFVNAELYYKKAMLVDMTDSFNATQYAKFLNSQNRMIEAMPALRHALSITEAEQNKAFIYDLLGNTYLELNNIDSAKSNFFKALDIYNEWYPTDPWIYDGHLAVELNNIGLLYSRTGQFQSSKYYLQQSLEFYYRLVKTDPIQYYPKLAQTTATLGEDYINIDALDSARFFLVKALDIFKQMSQEQISDNQRGLAAIYDDLGMVNGHMGALDTAIIYHEKALSIRRKQASQNFEKYALELSNTLNNMGNIYNAAQKYDLAIASFSECLALLKRIGTTSPNERYRIAMTDVNIGNSYKGLGQLIKAETYYQMSLDFFATSELKEIYSDQYAKICLIVADFYKTERKFPIAIELYSTSLNIYKEDIKKHSEIDFYYLNHVVGNLAEVYQIQFLDTQKANYKTSALSLIDDYKNIVSNYQIDVPAKLSAKIAAIDKSLRGN